MNPEHNGAGGSPDPPIIAVRNLSKTFGATYALRNVSLSVRSGEIRALLGHNGSGKSTLIKVLAGYHAPAEGAELSVRGEPVPLPLQPAQVSGLGISFVHQELALATPLSVVENLGVQGATGSGGAVLRPIRARAERARARSLLAALDLAVDVTAPIGSLTGAERAVVAIARALASLPEDQQGLLVLDEPTALLPQHEVDVVLGAVRRVQERGYGVLFVSHRLEEVRRIATTATILRDGQVIAAGAMAELGNKAIIRLLLDADTDPEAVERRPPRRADAPTTLTVESLGGTAAHDVSFELREGEIIGVAGLVGAGHEELPELLVGARRRATGQVRLRGKRLEGSTRRHMADGIVLLPGDRKNQGGVARASVRENVSLPTLARFFRRGWLRRDAENAEVATLLREYDVRPSRPEALLGELSGGNQQKALLGKWLGLGAAVVILHEPTSGVDVGARAQIIERVKDAADAGTSFIVISSEFGDLVELCDRVLICKEGALAGELRDAAITEHNIAAACLA